MLRDFLNLILAPLFLSMDSGGGGGGDSHQTVTNELPEYARPYYERLMARAEAQSNAPYTPYGGQRVQGFTPAQQAAFNQIGNMQEPGQIQSATNLTNAAAQGAMGEGLFQSGQIGSTYNPQATQMFAGPGNAAMFSAPDAVQSNFNAGQFNADTASQYMSPYQQMVIDNAKDEANRQFAQQQVAADAGAAQRGSFGGSRHALVQQEAQRGQNQLLNNIQTTGNQQAFENAQQQFERDRAARAQAGQMDLNAQQFNSGQQMQFGQAGQQNQFQNIANQMAYGQMGLQNQQFNEQQRQQAAQMALQGQTANEAARAAAAGVRQNAFGQMGQMANQLGQLGATQQDLAMQRANALNQIGTQQQQLGQQGLDVAYNDFVNQRDYNNQQLAQLSALLHGVPASANSDVVTSQPSGNPLGQLAGLGIAGLGAYNAYRG